MNWKNITNGYEFRIYFAQGNSGCKTVETIKLDLTEEEEFNKIKEILTHLESAIEKHFLSYTEKVAEYIASKTQIKEEEIMKVIQNIVLSDIKWDDQIANVSHIEVYRYENGTVQISYI